MTISPSQRCGPLVTVQHFIRMEVELKKKTSLVRQRQTVCLYGTLTFTRGVDSAVGPVVSLKKQQFDALVSFSYNLGLRALQRSTLLKLVKVNPNNRAIREEFLKFVKAKGRVIQGLKNRREREANLYFS